MPQPTASDVHVSRPLTNISIAFMQNAAAFIARQVFPEISVMHQGDLYYVWERDSWFRVEARERADGAPSAGGGFELTTDNYFAPVIAFHKDVTDRQRRNQDQAIDLDRSATRYVTRQMLLREEKDWATTHFGTGIWTTDLTGGIDFTEWDLAGSNPIVDVTDAGLTVETLTGFLPNTLVITPRVLNALKNNAEVLDRIKYTQTGQVTTGLLASLFEVERVLVSRAVENSAAEGLPRSMDYMYGDGAWLAYVNPSPSLEEPSAGYTFKWSGVSDLGTTIATSQFRMDELKADRVESESAWDQKVVAPDLAVFFDAPIT